jgi:hypothetical protein
MPVEQVACQYQRQHYADSEESRTKNLMEFGRTLMCHSGLKQLALKSIKTMCNRSGLGK